MVLGTAVAGLTCLADVTSANIVGYNSTTHKPGKYNLISLPFAGVAGGTSKLKDALSYINLKGAEDYADADIIQVWSYDEKGNGKYTDYMYYVDDTHEWDGWWNASATIEFDDCDENKDGLEAGWCAWYLSKGEDIPQMTFSGAVESSDDAQFWIYGGGYTLIANPFPVNLKLNDSSAVNWGKPCGAEEYADADIIQVWGFDAKGNGFYTDFMYYEDDTHEWDGWWNANATIIFEDVPGFENGLATGTAFWYLSRDAKGTNHKITFYSPLSK